MSNRNNWEFEYTASDLATAAQTKKAHHEGRLKYWEDKQKKVIAMVKENGLEVTESLSMMAYSGKGAIGNGQGAQLTVKNEYQTQLNECHTKINEHAGKIKEYDGWDQMLTANAKNRVSLDIGDYLFFFAK